MGQIENLIRSKIEELAFQKKFDQKRIFVFGYNGYTQYINNFLYQEGYSICGIIDNDEEKQGNNAYGIPILAPENIEWEEEETLVLIASKYEKSMRAQLQLLSGSVVSVSLVDLLSYEEKNQNEKKFWLDQNYDSEIEKITKGAAVYENLKKNQNLIIYLDALGDIFAGGLYFQAYKTKIKSSDVKIVVASEGVHRVAKLFGIENVLMISKEEMDAFVKYLLLFEIENPNIVVCSCIATLDTMARYKKIPFPKFWAKYFFRLDSYQVQFPSIRDEYLDEEELTKKGLIKNRSIILAPYANTIPELPYQFWELLTRSLLKMEYRVFTNIAGDQRPIRGSIGLKIPFHQISNYLEFAGHFVALRSGLCDIAGQSQCKQIIIFRDTMVDWHNTQKEYFDIHCENISENAIQYIYDDGEFTKNVDMIIELLLDK